MGANMTASNGIITTQLWPKSLKCLHTVTSFTWYTKDYNIWPLPKCQVWSHISCPAPCQPAALNCSVYAEHPTLSASYVSACSHLCTCVADVFIHVWSLHQWHAPSSKKASLIFLGHCCAPSLVRVWSFFKRICMDEYWSLFLLVRLYDDKGHFPFLNNCVLDHFWCKLEFTAHVKVEGGNVA